MKTVRSIDALQQYETTLETIAASVTVLRDDFTKAKEMRKK